MPTICPFCAGENALLALVCVLCSRDIAVPLSLTAERDSLSRKRDLMKEDLAKAKAELRALKPNMKPRLI
jgi:hypothetical protein